MRTWRCRTCYQIMLSQSDLDWHRIYLEHKHAYEGDCEDDEVVYLESNRGEEQ